MEKLKQTASQLLKYSVAAGIGLVVDFLTLIFFTEVLHLFYLLGVTAGFLAGLVVVYVLSNKYVFGESKYDHKKVFIIFGVIGLVGLGILNLLVWLLTSGLGINYVVSKALATVVVFTWNFFARKMLYNEE